MNMREVVMRLQEQGHHVSYSIRSDGGILIRYIDGQHYTGAKGNAAARQLVGVTISEARIKQLKYATRARGVKKPSLDDEVLQEFKRVKKKWNKAFKSKGGKPHPAGYFGWKRIKYTLETYGKEEALRRISEAERYISGYAYSKNVEHLIDYIKMTAEATGSEELLQLVEDIAANSYNIKEEWIQPAYDSLYKLNAGAEPKQVAAEIRRILRL